MMLRQARVHTVAATVGHLVPVGAHVSRSCNQAAVIVVSLLDEADLFCLALALKWDVIHHVDAAIHIFLLWQ